MSRVYTTSEILVGATKIKVRQVLFTEDRRAKHLVAAATIEARRWLQNTIPIRPSNAYESQIAHLFKFFFHAEPYIENTNIVWSVLNLIRQGLEQPFAIKISNAPTKEGYIGYVSGYPVAPCPKRDGKIYHWNEDHKELRRQGEIHLYRGILDKVDVAPMMLIHEAGHRFANLDDFGDEGYFYENFTNLDEYRLRWHECMRNAASYAAFVYFVANPAVAQRLLTQELLKQNRRKVAGGTYT